MRSKSQDDTVNWRLFAAETPSLCGSFGLTSIQRLPTESTEDRTVNRFHLCFVCCVLSVSFVSAQRRRPATNLPEPPATKPETLKVAKDFRVELLHSVPKDKQGSWVNMCVDPKGRLIVSDQYGGLFRITPPAIGGKAEDTKIEKIPAPIGEAQGLLWAFNSLYVVVNRGDRYQSGLYRVRDTLGNDTLNSVELLRKIDGAGEHGPHAVLLHPDGKRLVVVCGDGTKLTKFNQTRVPTNWGEDHLLPRMPDGRGFMRGVLGPGGAIYYVRSGRQEMGADQRRLSQSVRRRVQHADGELFTYDSDMEWDMNTPWYRPDARLPRASAAASSAGATAPANGRRTIPTTCPPSSTSAPARPPA